MPKSPHVIDVEKLIVLVQERPCIWDLRAGEYQDRYKKDAAWSEITQELFAPIWEKTQGPSRRNLNVDIDTCSFHVFVLPVEEVKNRWRSCRDQFRKEMKHRGRSRSGPPKKRPYLFREQLMFLRDVMELRPTEDNLEEEADESGPHQSGACEEDTTSAQPESGAGPSTAPSRPPAASGGESPTSPLALPSRARRRAMPPAESNINLQVLDYLSRARQEDHHDMFARSLAHFMRQLPPERLLRTRTALEIVLEVANRPQEPTEMFDALESLRCHGNIFSPHHPAGSQPSQGPQQFQPQRDPYGPPIAPYVPQFQGEPCYSQQGPSSSQPGPSQYSGPPSQTQLTGPQYQGPSSSQPGPSHYSEPHSQHQISAPHYQGASSPSRRYVNL
ncbi:transcriptional regulator DEF1-like [Bufo gargarizans]|uniref:transcriptional regulator DEF1-like n=1 Tax=Bufo gargarizans TaxID=30331 RepID=UPI001CF106DC|nr:transcriptional regulator DEF1-like [Bufo gargarizans]